MENKTWKPKGLFHDNIVAGIVAARGGRHKPLMAPDIVRSASAVTLLGGGKVDPRDLEEALGHAPTLVAADGGANLAAELGHSPVAVIGDMDSIDSQILAAIPARRRHRISEQETTDFDKALRAICAPLVLGLGFTGARIDHELSVFHSLLAHPARRCILIGEEDVIFLLPAALCLDLPEGARLSLYPLAPSRVTGRGLAWPLEALALAAGQRIGTSNAVREGPVEITSDRPGALVLLERRHLEAAMEGLLGAALHPPS